jgi:HlyD family secretion protein
LKDEWMSRKILIDLSALAFVTTTLVLGLCSCSGKTGKESGPLVSVQAVRVRRTEIQQKVSSDAVLFPLQQATIVPKVNAPVAKFYVNRGDHVRAGQLLAVLEHRDLAATVTENEGAYRQAQANYESTMASSLPEQIQKAEVNLKNAKAAHQAAQQLYESSKKLYEQGALAKMQLNQAEVGLTQTQTQLQTAEQQLEKLQSVGQKAQSQAAQGQLAAAKGKYENAQALLAYTEIRSPINGVVTDRPLYAGEMPAPGAPLITVMDTSQVIAKAHISQQDAEALRVGNPATIAAPGVPGDIPGKVTIVSPALDPNSTTVEVWVEARNRGGQLKPGTSVRVTIVAKTVKDALVIPASALLTAQDGSTSVFVAHDEKPEEKSVKTGIRDGNDVQITEGLKGGEQVVTAGAYDLSEEDPDVLAKTRLQIVSPQTSQEAGGKESKQGD